MPTLRASEPEETLTPQRPGQSNMRSDSASNQASPLKAWVRALEMTAPIERNPSVTLPLVVETLADQFGDALALTDGHEQLTYKGLAQTANRYARWALRQGLAAGDVVCLFMPNR